MNNDVKKVIERSGNNFHFIVAKKLRELGWDTLISPYYVDTNTEKPREIDIVATKFLSRSRDLMWPQDPVLITLFIECKYVGTPTVFWFDNVDKRGRAKKITNDFKLSVPVGTDDEQEAYINAVLKHHHMSNGLVAKLVSSQANSEQDFIYKALNQCLNSMIFFRMHSAPNQMRYSTNNLSHLTYPIIIANDFGSFYTQEGKKIEDSFMLEVNYANNQVTSGQEYFLVDVVEYGEYKLDGFLLQLESEGRKLGFLSSESRGNS